MTMDDCLKEISLSKIERKGQTYLLTFSNNLEFKATGKSLEQLGLSEGSDFTVDEFEKLRPELEQRFAYYVAESTLATRTYSIGEFREKLQYKGLAKTYIDRIIKDFLAQNLLDDYRFAAVKLQTLMEHKPAGRPYLIAYLQSRRVPREIAERAADEVLDQTSESDIAARLLTKRRASFMKFDVETARRKAYNYLSRRGISYRAAKEAFENLFIRPID